MCAYVAIMKFNSETVLHNVKNYYERGSNIPTSFCINKRFNIFCCCRSLRMWRVHTVHTQHVLGSFGKALFPLSILIVWRFLAKLSLSSPSKITATYTSDKTNDRNRLAVVPGYQAIYFMLNTQYYLN